MPLLARLGAQPLGVIQLDTQDRFKKFTQETGLSEEQARKVVDWLLADERKR